MGAAPDLSVSGVYVGGAVASHVSSHEPEVFKVGKADNAERRFNQQKTGFSEPHRLYRIYQSDSPFRSESSIHLILKDQGFWIDPKTTEGVMGSEWFRCALDDIDEAARRASLGSKPHYSWKHPKDRNVQWPRYVKIALDHLYHESGMKRGRSLDATRKDILVKWFPMEMEAILDGKADPVNCVGQRIDKMYRYVGTSRDEHPSTWIDYDLHQAHLVAIGWPYWGALV